MADIRVIVALKDGGHEPEVHTEQINISTVQLMFSGIGNTIG